MPKVKTKRSAAKRFTKTASGKFKRAHSHASHIFTKKSPKRKRHLRKADLVHKSDTDRVRNLLPYA